MIRRTAPALAVLLLTAGLAFADPAVHVSYRDGVPRVQIEGDYAHSTYTIQRATRAEGPFAPITRHDVLCLGTCFVEDHTALPEIEYHYRFDLVLPGGDLVSYGPYRITHSRAALQPARARVFPNPGSGPVTIELTLAGEAAQAGLAVRASVFDAQGRRVRDLYRGTLPRGLTSLPWDGRDDAGATLGPGLYFLRFSTPIGRSVTRVLRTP